MTNTNVFNMPRRETVFDESLAADYIRRRPLGSGVVTRIFKADSNDDKDYEIANSGLYSISEIYSKAVAAMEGFQIVIAWWVLFALTTSFVAIRLYVEFRVHYRPWKEVFVITAWLLFLASAICVSLMNDWDFWNVNFEGLSDEALTDVGKVNFAKAFFYYTSQYAAKAAFLCFYNHLTPRRLYPKTWWLIVAAWFIVITGTLQHVLYTFLGCQPFYLNWSFQYSECWYNIRYRMTSLAFHGIANLLVYTIPFVILHNLKTLAAKEKRTAFFVFGLGALSLVIVIVFVLGSLLEFTGVMDDWGEGLVDAWYVITMFLYPLQQATAIILICLPQARRLWLGTSAEVIRRQNEQLQGRMSEIPDLHGSQPSGVREDLKTLAASEGKLSSNHRKASEGATSLDTRVEVQSNRILPNAHLI